MRTENKIKVNIIRHGKTEYNERHCYIGITDAALSENGISEIVKKKEENIYPKVDKLFVSPMLRARQSAEIMYPEMPFEIIEDFSEMDFGSFERKNYDDLKENLHYRCWIDKSRGASDKEIEEMYGVLSNPLDEGIVLPEDMDSYYKRVVSGFIDVLRQSDSLSCVSIVAHGGTIMAIASFLSKEDYYSFMLGCGDGIVAEVVYSNDDGNIEISRFSVIDRICS